MSFEVAVLLLGWGTLVGLDLTSVMQSMIARPIVAGAIAGAILGDLPSGLRIGVMFELLQYDILPLGASRYPEYGPATVAATATAHLLSGALGLGLGAVVGLFTGLLGGVSMNAVRRLNTNAVHRAAPALEAGDTQALMRLHVASIGRDAVRALLVTGSGLVLATGTHALPGQTIHVRGAVLLAAAATGAVIAAGTSGTVRLIGRGSAIGWFAAGLLGGVAGAWLR
ncbi:MAG TPA: PTS sugar transporter subunit IIC [Gemmatimonadales bacterium]|nr:PTS sugar transporter subunit IIC [Gemmatimonadales bacterium]